jgi:hypothetical protein
MSNNWYQKERGKAALADELRKLGWTIHGYTEDRSDARSDYYAPAHWHGVATKDGAVLVVDIDHGFDGEQVVGKRVYTTTHYLQEFGVTWMSNPPRKNWHVERDGKIVASGNGIGSIDSFKSGEAALKRILFDIERAVRQPVAANAAAGNDEPTQTTATTAGTVSVGRNAAKGGIEIKFSVKPAETIIARLHAAGFRFSYRQSLWYGKDTPDRWEAAMRIYHAAMLRDTAEVAPPIVPEIVIVHDVPAPDPEPDNAPTDPAPAATTEPAPMTWEARVLAAASANPDLLKVKPRGKKQQPATAMEALPLFSFCAEPELESELEPEPELAPPAVIATADDEVEVIYTYSHQQAVEDGMLIDVSLTARRMGFDVPVFVTNTVWVEAICPDGVNGGSRTGLFLAYVKGILRNLHEEDALSNDLIELPMTLPMVGVHVVRDGKEVEPEERTLWLHLGANDEGEPIFKIMFPEDW